MTDKYEKWYRRRLHNYMEEHYGELEDQGEIEWFNDPAPNQWLFDIPEQNVRVELTCDKKGNVTEQRYILPMNSEGLYELLKKECSGMDAIYEDYIIELIGITGFNILRAKKLLGTCGSVNGRNLYVLN